MAGEARRKECHIRSTAPDRHYQLGLLLEICGSYKLRSRLTLYDTNYVVSFIQFWLVWTPYQANLQDEVDTVTNVNEKLKTEKHKLGTYGNFFHYHIAIYIDAEITRLKNEVESAKRSGENAKVSGS